MVMPRRFSSGRRSVSMPVSARTSEVLPWSMWPAVPTTRLWRGMRNALYVSGQTLPVDLAQLRRHVHPLSHELLQIAGVDDGLSAKVIVRDHVRVGALRHLRDPLRPRR